MFVSDEDLISLYVLPGVILLYYYYSDLLGSKYLKKQKIFKIYIACKIFKKNNLKQFNCRVLYKIGTEQ